MANPCNDAVNLYWFVNLYYTLSDCADSMSFQVGYVMQPGAAAGGSAYGADRGYGGRGRGGGGGYGGAGSQRYRPY